jgi:hypothetical protein
MNERIHLFGIRHHGPGSARSLLQALNELRPDIILIEGPPDAADLIELVAHPDMQPPVALLVYAPDDPSQAVYYPFARFSPEWQALGYAFEKQIPARFIDLPMMHQLAVEREERAKRQTEEGESEPSSADTPPSDGPIDLGGDSEQSEAEASPEQIWQERLRRDPLSQLAQAAGFEDSERWWNFMVEQRGDSQGMFEAIREAMIELRKEGQRSYESPERERYEARREAWMRQSLRAALSEGFERIAVICGAWHVPALAELPPAKEDTALLKGMPKLKVQATWIPWTFERLSMASGYGAGIESPGWYSHLWEHQDRSKIVPAWMTQVARLLRDEGLDASSASVIEAVRLADALAAMRNQPLPGLQELNEATETLFCFGDTLPLQLISHKLIIGEVLGQVPDETPMVPLQQDLAREQKRLRMPAEAAYKDYDLDLRKPNELARSQLLHRLALLGIHWGRLINTRTSTGTFREEWRVEWQPEMMVGLITAGVWGNTIPAAAGASARKRAEDAKELAELTQLIDAVLLADLPDTIEYIVHRIETVAAISSDVLHLMAALPPLANVLRYGNVRQTDTSMLGHVVNGLVARICIGLPPACGSLNDDAAEEVYKHMIAVNNAIALLQNDDYTRDWQATLSLLSQRDNLHGLIAGRAYRLLLDRNQLSREETASRMSYALSTASDPTYAATWIEGMLREGAVTLLYDDLLWQVLDEWICNLDQDVFVAILPLLRRTFSTFESAERRQLGERAKGSQASTGTLNTLDKSDLDQERAERVLPLVAQLLGIS